MLSYGSSRNTLVKLHVTSDLRLTPFSQKNRNIDIYRRLIIAEPFDGCSPMQIPSNLEQGSYFILANGPSCSYRQKAYHAMRSGAIGIVIIDDDPHRLE